MNDELLPCPFCGGEVTISEGSYDYDGGDRFLYYSADVVCYKCDLTMHVSNNSHEHVPLKHALDFAAKAWNKRVKRYPESLAQRMIADGYEYELFELRKDYEHKLSELRQQLEKKQQTVSIVIEPGTELKEGQTLRVDDDGHVTLNAWGD